MDISDFEGKIQPNDVLDSLNIVEIVFEHCDLLEHKKVKLVVVKLRKYTSFWWENLKRQRLREGRKSIVK